jgi:hypothetical protein
MVPTISSSIGRSSLIFISLCVFACLQFTYVVVNMYYNLNADTEAEVAKGASMMMRQRKTDLQMLLMMIMMNHAHSFYQTFAHIVNEKTFISGTVKCHISPFAYTTESNVH